MRNGKLSVAFGRLAVPVALLGLILLLHLLFPQARLLSFENLKTIFLQASVLGFLALGLSFVMTAGESDISFAGTLGMMGATFTMLTNAGWHVLAALPVVMAIGVAIG